MEIMFEMKTFCSHVFDHQLPSPQVNSIETIPLDETTLNPSIYKLTICLDAYAFPDLIIFMMDIINPMTTHYVALNVELMGPHLMLEYVTEALADLDSTSVGAPESLPQVPRETPATLASLAGG
jgi:hypothetical protein